MRSGSPKVNEMVRWTISSDERAELGRGAGELPDQSAATNLFDMPNIRRCRVML